MRRNDPQGAGFGPAQVDLDPGAEVGVEGEAVQHRLRGTLPDEAVAEAELGLDRDREQRRTPKIGRRITALAPRGFAEDVEFGCPPPKVEGERRLHLGPALADHQALRMGDPAIALQGQKPGPGHAAGGPDDSMACLVDGDLPAQAFRHRWPDIRQSGAEVVEVECTARAPGPGAGGADKARDVGAAHPHGLRGDAAEVCIRKVR